MKSFKELNHYEVLNVSFHAEAEEIERAYRETLHTYDKDSLITYSLFSDDQRNDLLQRIDEAYQTLIDPAQRQAYDRLLNNAGFLTAAPSAAASQERSAPPQPAHRPPPVRHRDLYSWVKNKSQEEAVRSLSEGILSKHLLSGSDLKRLRQALGIEIEEIYEKTRIAGSVLKMIEDDTYDQLPADIFLRAFLRSYAEILQLEPKCIVEGYFKAKQTAARL